jgi:hypothetical protein
MPTSKDWSHFLSQKDDPQKNANTFYQAPNRWKLQKLAMKLKL